MLTPRQWVTSLFKLRARVALRHGRRVSIVSTPDVTVRAIAFLDTYQKERGRPSTLQVDVPDEGTTAFELATSLELPVDRIEGVFLNKRVAGLDARVRPGDRVAYVPVGTPASHPAFFGPFVTR